jgi:hypothetical protein
MSTFLKELGAQALGRAPSVLPVVEPLFAGTAQASQEIETFATSTPLQARARSTVSIPEPSLERRPLTSSTVRESLLEQASPDAEPSEADSIDTDARFRGRESHPFEEPSSPHRIERALVDVIAPRPDRQSALNLTQESAMAPATVTRESAWRPALEQLKLRASWHQAGEPQLARLSQQAAVSHEEKSAPVVRVTIGRIEVRANVAAPPIPPPQRPAPVSRSLSLEEYLSKKPGGRR